jgi:hypothetical protein
MTGDSRQACWIWSIIHILVKGSSKEFNEYTGYTPATYPWGCRAFEFKDPDGNNIDFLSPIDNK